MLYTYIYVCVSNLQFSFKLNFTLPDSPMWVALVAFGTSWRPQDDDTRDACVAKLMERKDSDLVVIKEYSLEHFPGGFT